MPSALKEFLHAIGYGLMMDVVFVPVYVILGVALLGGFGLFSLGRKRKNGRREGEDRRDT